MCEEFPVATAARCERGRCHLWCTGASVYANLWLSRRNAAGNQPGAAPPARRPPHFPLGPSGAAAPAFQPTFQAPKPARVLRRVSASSSGLRDACARHMRSLSPTAVSADNAVLEVFSCASPPPFQQECRTDTLLIAALALPLLPPQARPQPHRRPALMTMMMRRRMRKQVCCGFFLPHHHLCARPPFLSSLSHCLSLLMSPAARHLLPSSTSPSADGSRASLRDLCRDLLLFVAPC